MRGAEDFWKRSLARSSRREIVSRFLFGTSMPTVDLPAMRSMRIDSASIARHRSSDSVTILLYFTPGSGLNSNTVTTGPGWMAITCPVTSNSRHFSVRMRAVSTSSFSSTCMSWVGGLRSDRGGGV